MIFRDAPASVVALGTNMECLFTSTVSFQNHIIFWQEKFPKCSTTFKNDRTKVQWTGNGRLKAQLILNHHFHNSKEPKVKSVRRFINIKSYLLTFFFE